ncbi:MAG: MltA domain-containing protein [Caulobacteraceae bacterium]|nr:MltA domain-containing protein [Caulobacteraceae bacterium]
MIRMSWARLAAVVAVALTVTACASNPPPAPQAPAPATSRPERAPPAEPNRPGPPPSERHLSMNLADLRGWAEEDHAGALLAFEAGCAAAKEAPVARLCRRARSMGALAEPDARGFLEANFRAEPVGDHGLLTAYFAPEYEARASRRGDFTAPVRPKPADLVTLDLGLFDPGLAGRKISGRIVGGQFLPYPDRAAIEAAVPDQPLAWMRPEELFFLQIQGSGLLRLPDGRRLKVVYSANNGRPFVGIANVLRDRGALPADGLSGDAIRAWLAAHRGPEADDVMRQNPRYVFFKTASDDGAEPVGAAGLPLIPGRSLAVDPTKHAMGGLYWIDATAPSLTGAFPAYRRLALALDTGGAIKGDVRADLYLGSGAEAGVEAGRVRHALSLYAIAPADSALP